MENNELASRLKQLRKSANYTQDYVAGVLGIVRQTYSHYETGTRTPGYDVLYKLAGLYHIPLEDFLHLCIVLDDNEYYDAPLPSEMSKDIATYLDFISDPENITKYEHLSKHEKELMYFYQQLNETDKIEILEYIRFKATRDHENKRF